MADRNGGGTAGMSLNKSTLRCESDPRIFDFIFMVFLLWQQSE
jgi:hypothetical protein